MQDDKDEVPTKEEVSGCYGATERMPHDAAVANAVSNMHEVARAWDIAHSSAASDACTPNATSIAYGCTAGVAAAPIAQEMSVSEVPPACRAPGPPSAVTAGDPGADGRIGSVGSIVRGVTGLHSAPPPPRGSGLLSGQPTGGDSEPWSMMGSFEDLLNGLVTDEPDEEEATLPGRSRFARFFSSSSLDDAVPGGVPVFNSALASLGGIKLDTTFEQAGGKQQDDWQQGFRALLPNVNISFSPFGDTTGPMAHGDGVSQSASLTSTASSLGAVGGLGGLAGFSGFGTSGMSSLGPSSTPAAVGSASVAFAPGCVSGLGGSFDLPSDGLGSNALNGSSGLPGLGSTPTTSESILQQLSSSSGQLPSAELQLSSQLQSLLQAANGPSAGMGCGRALGVEGHMPGWDGLLSSKGDEQPKEPGGNISARKKVRQVLHDPLNCPATFCHSVVASLVLCSLPHALQDGGNEQRGGKGKKRGGTSNRGGKSSDPKLPPGHSGK